MTRFTLPRGRRSKRSALAATAAILAIGAVGCGGSSATKAKSSAPVDPNAAEVNPAGDIPDNQAFVRFTPPGGGFSVKVPEGWSRSDSGGAVVFTDKLNAIRVESVPAQAPLTTREARGTEVPKLAASVKGFKPGSVATITRKAGSAVRITYLAAAKPNPVTGKAGQDAVERYVFFHQGKDVILTLSGPKGADNVDPWRIVTDSVTWAR
ncbi:MAG: hypothetical protein HZB46_05460 [Solirubrobacterales bacterium]|nr:hypothetical protein [Solirubrobacterales bacterium]